MHEWLSYGRLESRCVLCCVFACAGVCLSYTDNTASTNNLWIERAEWPASQPGIGGAPNYMLSIIIHTLYNYYYYYLCQSHAHIQTPLTPLTPLTHPWIGFAKQQHSIARIYRASRTPRWTWIPATASGMRGWAEVWGGRGRRQTVADACGSLRKRN